MLTEPAASNGLTTLSQLYGFVGSAARFAVEHIDTLKQADYVLANRCGHVLEAANIGFGVGHETALVLIGVGQGLLGNPLTGGMIASATANPIAMTCAAIGAVHYGWKAMSDSERDRLLKTVGTAFGVGVELIRSLASFASDLIQRLMSRDNFEELRKLVAGAAASFGRHLSDVTQLLSDRVSERAQYVYAGMESAATTAWSYVPNVRKPKAETKAAAIEDKLN